MNDYLDNVPDEWTEKQRELFSRLYRFFQANPQAVVHPEMGDIDPEHWHTLAWNAAYFAAHAAFDGDPLCVMDEDTEEVVAMEVPNVEFN